MLWPRPSAPESTPWGTPSLAAEGAYIPIDPNGNLTSKAEGTDVWGYEWNARNELTRVTKNTIEQARLSYDAIGRRVEKIAGGVTTSYTYDREDIIREVRGAATFKYAHGLGIDEPLLREDGSGALTYYHADGLGSIAKHTSQAGAVVHEYRYDAWGNIEAGSTEPGFAFTDREWDPEPGLYYYRARYYDPKIGRFISEDPLAAWLRDPSAETQMLDVLRRDSSDSNKVFAFDTGSLGVIAVPLLSPRHAVQLYDYVANNPVNKVDPSGLWPKPSNNLCKIGCRLLAAVCILQCPLEGPFAPLCLTSCVIFEVWCEKRCDEYCPVRK